MPVLQWHLHRVFVIAGIRIKSFSNHRHVFRSAIQYRTIFKTTIHSLSKKWNNSMCRIADQSKFIFPYPGITFNSTSDEVGLLKKSSSMLASAEQHQEMFFQKMILLFPLYSMKKKKALLQKGKTKCR